MEQPKLSVSDALELILDGAARLGEETVELADAYGRILAEPIIARRTQPPFESSAMDGYAVRADDAVEGASLSVIGEAAAGHLFDGQVAAGQAVRIFTGGAVPSGADSVLIQENTERTGDSVRVTVAVNKGQHVRSAGVDYRDGDLLVPEGARFSPRSLALAAASGRRDLKVAKRPRVAIVATGDELVPPGIEPGPGQITASNNAMLSALVIACGGVPVDLGLVADTLDDTQLAVKKAQDLGADLLVTSGGASVGEHDLVQKALVNEGLKLDFWRIAMRPGRPIMSGRLGAMRFIGLPGNPVSAYTGGILFLVPLLRALQGCAEIHHRLDHAVLATDLPANDWRADHLRARLTLRDGEPPLATPFARQDSSMMRVLAEADCLIVRPAEDVAKKAGETCRIIRLAPNL